MQQSNDEFVFHPYTNSTCGFKYDKSKYHRNAVYSYLRCHPSAKPKEIQKYFESQIQTYIDDVVEQTEINWSAGQWRNVVSEARRAITTGTPWTLNPYDLRAGHRKMHRYKHLNKAVDQLQSLLIGYNEENVIHLFNAYCKRKKISIKYGDCIEAKRNMQSIMPSLSQRFRYTVCQRQKQSILSSIVSQENGYITESGKSILYGVTNGKIRSEGYLQSAKRRYQYDENESVYLYDRRFDGKYKTFDKTNSLIRTDIIKYYEEQGKPSPHTNDQLIIDHNTGAKPGHKPKHTRHRIHGTQSQFYADWCVERGKELCLRLNEPIPCYTSFRALCPVWVQFEKGISFDLCKNHWNFESVFKVFKRKLKNIIF